MSDTPAIDVVRSRYSKAPDQDAADLQAFAEHLERLRQRVRAEDIHSTEVAVTFVSHWRGPR
ncbi:MAG TPA: hypothetical protein VFI97_00080 [Arthrobacter sp.]|nr:hypothetical protein [Arthrobacter sp.]